MLNIFIHVDSEPYYFQQKAFYIPHPQKAHRGGEDAYFANDQLLIVSDGVGGWNQMGIDPSKYSRFLCSQGSVIFSQNKNFFKQYPIELIVQTSKSNKNLGSATMVFLTLNEDKLKTCYIGDSGFIILRQIQGQLSLLYQYKQQQHSFNFPYQLADGNNGDDPYQSICQNFDIQQNDILIVASDGLFDNIYVEEILQQVKKVYSNTNNNAYNQQLYDLTQKFAKLAIERGTSGRFISPFSKRAKQHKLNYVGGKLDDTTIIISTIKRTNQLIIYKQKDQLSNNLNNINIINNIVNNEKKKK